MFFKEFLCLGVLLADQADDSGVNCGRGLVGTCQGGVTAEVAAADGGHGRHIEIGYVQSIHGKGVVVIYQKSGWSEFSIGVIESLKEAAARNNVEYHTRVLVLTEFVVDERLHERLGFEIGAEVYYLLRVRYINNLPVIMDNNWFLKSVVPGLTEEIAADSVYAYMEHVLGESIVTAKRIMTVEKATEIDRKYLDLGDYDCLAVVTSHTFNADGIMFEYTESRHRPDRFAFSTMAARRKN